MFHEFLFVYKILSLVPDTDVIVTVAQYFVCCITHSFQLWRKTFNWHSIDASIDQWHSRLKTHM